MPIRYMNDTGSDAADAGPGAAACAVFEGACAPEEADGLLEWLRAAPDAACDLTACGDLHTSLLQLLLAARVRLAAAPADMVLASCLAGLPVGAAASGQGLESATDPASPPPQARARRRTRAAADQPVASAALQDAPDPQAAPAAQAPPAPQASQAAQAAQASSVLQAVT